jgi:hypothetical protein
MNKMYGACTDSRLIQVNSVGTRSARRRDYSLSVIRIRPSPVTRGPLAVSMT